MKTSDPQPPPTNLSLHQYYQLVHTLTGLLPPPLDDSPEALRARHHAAIAKMAAMLPVNANEADLAAQCIAARAQAEELLRLIRQNAGDIALTIRLNVQYTSMVRTSLSVQACLMRVQAVRQKREAIEATATQDAWTQHIAEQSMLKVTHPDIERVAAASPPTARGEAPEAAPAETPQRDQRIAENVSEYNSESHDAAFETWVRERPRNWPGETEMCRRVREAMTAELRLAWRELSADGRASPSGQVWHGG